jgi:hypothetical protein
MSFKRQRKGSKKGMGILLILVVVAVMFYYMEGSNSTSNMETVPQVRMEFAGGESISFYQPVEYTEEVSMEMADTALAKYFTDQQKSIPETTQTDSERSDLGNRMITEDEVDTSVSAPLNENVIGGEIGNTYYTRQGDPLEGQKEYEVLDGVPTFTRGHIINIVGKIEKSDPAPYFFNIVIRMGNDNPIRSGSYIETNYDGTFLYNFPSDLTWRTGTYTATISTIGDDSSVLTFDWVFDIIE